MPRRPKGPESLQVSVPLPPDAPGALVFKFEMNEAQVRALSEGRVLEETQELAQGLLQWLEEDDQPAPASVAPGSSIKVRKASQARPAAPQAPVPPADPPQEPQEPL